MTSYYGDCHKGASYSLREEGLYALRWSRVVVETPTLESESASIILFFQSAVHATRCIFCVFLFVFWAAGGMLVMDVTFTQGMT